MKSRIAILPLAAISLLFFCLIANGQPMPPVPSDRPDGQPMPPITSDKPDLLGPDYVISVPESNDTQSEESQSDNQQAYYGSTSSIPLEYDTDRLGSDYKNFAMGVNDPSACAQACFEDPTCKAFTFVKPNSGQGPDPRCWLKNAVPPRKQASCCVSGVKPGSGGQQAADLTGVWGCTDGGKYYIRQIGDKVWWYGENNPNSPSFANVFYGTIVPVSAGEDIQGNWADVPKGQTSSSGTLQIRIETDNYLSVIQQTGGFGGLSWTRQF